MNDGDIKVIANKLYWKYIRQDKANLIRSLYVKSQSIASTSNTTFWWALQTQMEWVIFERARTHHLGFKAQNFESWIFTFGCFSLKAVCKSCKLKILLQVAKFWFIHYTPWLFTFQAPTYWNYHLHKRFLPDEVFQWW